MPKGNDDKTRSAPPGVVNWNPPSKQELVERARSDGMTDAAQIAAWASNYQVSMTAEEVLQLMAQLERKDRK